MLSVAQKCLSLSLYMATKRSHIPRNLNFLGETAIWGGIFCLEYPSRCSEEVNCHFLNYRLSFRKLQILILQTADSHFANYRFSFRKLQIYISQTTDFHFANYRFSFRFVPFRFVVFRSISFRKLQETADTMKLSDLPVLAASRILTKSSDFPCL